MGKTWDAPKFGTVKSDLTANLYDNFPAERSPKLRLKHSLICCSTSDTVPRKLCIGQSGRS
jgi:hypothetical protein